MTSSEYKTLICQTAATIYAANKMDLKMIPKDLANEFKQAKIVDSFHVAKSIASACGIKEPKEVCYEPRANHAATTYVSVAACGLQKPCSLHDKGITETKSNLLMEECGICHKRSADVSIRPNAFANDVGNDPDAMHQVCDDCDYKNRMDI